MFFNVIMCSRELIFHSFVFKFLLTDFSEYICLDRFCLNMFVLVLTGFCHRQTETEDSKGQLSSQLFCSLFS